MLTRQQGAAFIITSDRCSTETLTTYAQRRRRFERYEVWTGETWSAVMTEAMTFATLDDADDYVRVNFAKVTGIVSPPQKPRIRRPKHPSK